MARFERAPPFPGSINATSSDYFRTFAPPEKVKETTACNKLDNCKASYEDF